MISRSGREVDADGQMLSIIRSFSGRDVPQGFAESMEAYLTRIGNGVSYTRNTVEQMLFVKPKSFRPNCRIRLPFLAYESRAFHNSHCSCEFRCSKGKSNNKHHRIGRGV